MTKVRRCYDCRTELTAKGIFCDECRDKPRTKGSSTLIIYNKI